MTHHPPFQGKVLAPSRRHCPGLALSTRSGPPSMSALQVPSPPQEHSCKSPKTDRLPPVLPLSTTTSTVVSAFWILRPYQPSSVSVKEGDRNGYFGEYERPRAISGGFLAISAAHGDEKQHHSLSVSLPRLIHLIIYPPRWANPLRRIHQRINQPTDRPTDQPTD